MTRPRVLLIAHHFPPSGGSGSNRALAFARYVGEYGWDPVVITPGTAWATNRDDDLLRQLPEDVRVIRTRSFEPRPTRRQAPLTPALSQREREPASHRERERASQGEPASASPSGTGRQERAGEGYVRASNAIRSNIGHLKRFPDAHLGWLPFALAAARRQSYEVTYSTSGPFTSHLVGLLLKRFTKRPWLAELRDGWYRWNRAIFPDYPAWRDLLERNLESAALRSADRVILVTDRMADAFRTQYPSLPSDRFAVVHNGFDPAQLGSPGPRRRASQWNVLHAGALYYGRSLAAFLEAVHGVIASDADFAAHFRLTLLGTLDMWAGAELTASRLDQTIRLRGQVGHADTLEAMRSADVLLLVANTTPGAEATVPGKLFEYLAIGRPILAVAPRDSSTADILTQTGGGWVAPPGDPGAIACALRQAFSQHRVGQSCAADPNRVARFNRRLLTGDLAHLLDQAVASSNAARRA